MRLVRLRVAATVSPDVVAAISTGSPWWAGSGALILAVPRLAVHRSRHRRDSVSRIRGYCATLRKQGVALLTALQTVFSGQPLYPALG